MGGNIRGITIQFNGDTTKLDKALKQVNTEARKIDKELREVDKALKFNPTNVDLWRQKQQLLNEKVEKTKEKLDALKQAQAKMDADGVDKNSEEYRKLQREIITTESKLKHFKTQLNQVGNARLKATSEHFKQWGTKLEQAGRAMAGLSKAAAAVLVSMGALAVKSGKWADELNTASKRYGIGTTELQKYAAAADLVDVSVETIAKSHVRLEKDMLNAQNGSKKQRKAFEKLGVAYENADGTLRDSDDVFNDVIKALGDMENETERDAIAMQLLGQSASELNPLIEDGGETYERTAKLFKKYGLDFIDQDTLDRANEFNDQLDTIKALGLITFQSIGAKLAGYLAPALEKVVDFVGKIAGWLSKLSPEALSILGIIAGIVAVTSPLLIGLGKMAFAISAIINLMAVAGPAIAGVLSVLGPAVLIIGAVVAAGILLYKNWDKIKAKAIELYKALKKTFESIKKTIINVWNSVKTAVTNRVNSIKTKVANTWNSIKDKTKTTWSSIKTAINERIEAARSYVATKVNWLRDKLKEVWAAIRDKAEELWDKTKTKITEPIDEAEEKLSETIGKIKTTAKDTWDSIKTTAEETWTKIKDAMTSPIDKAKEKISGIIEKIKSKFPIKLGDIFKFRLPSFEIEWTTRTVLGKEIRYPSGWDVTWHAKGGIFRNPTLLAGADGSVHGLGESGAEAIIPLDQLWKRMDRIAESGGITINVYGTDGMSAKDLAAEVERRLITAQKRRSLAWQ